VTARRCGRPSK